MNRLAHSILARASKRQLTVSPERLQYALAQLFDNSWLPRTCQKALYIGVGHGHDALAALLDGRFSYLDGVDPYVSGDGNDIEDYLSLLELVRHLEIQSRVTIHKVSIQEFLCTYSGTPYNLIVAADVLHHIFVEKEALRQSRSWHDAVSLFRGLRRMSEAGAKLIIADVERHGLRPWLSRARLLPGLVDYSTKQSRFEWLAAATAAGWTLEGMRNYVPWALRRMDVVFEGVLGRYTACDRYFLYLRCS